MRAWVTLAQIVKTKTLRGGLVVHSTTGPSFFLEEGTEVNFVPPTLEGPRSATVQSVQFLKEDTYLVFFEGITDADQAESLVDSFCLVKNTGFAFDDLQEAESEELEGMTVEDEVFGPLGILTAVLENPGQTLIEVQNDARELLIPYVDEFVKEVNYETRNILVSLPQGLLDLAVPLQNDIQSAKKKS